MSMFLTDILIRDPILLSIVMSGYRYYHMQYVRSRTFFNILSSNVVVFRSTINSPPPSYSEVNSELPPNYEDVVKEDKTVTNIPL